MNAKDKAEIVINHLKDKGFTEEDIVAGVMGFLKYMNQLEWEHNYLKESERKRQTQPPLRTRARLSPNPKVGGAVRMFVLVAGMCGVCVQASHKTPKVFQHKHCLWITPVDNLVHRGF